MKAETGDSFMMSLTSRTSQTENKFRRPASYFSILEVHTVLFQVSLGTGRGEGKKGARRNAQGF